MSTKIKLEKLEQELADIEAKLTIEESRKRIGLSRSEILEHIRSSLKKDPRQLINALINKVVLYDDKIEIYYNYTIRKSPDDCCQGFLFYSMDSTIKKCVTFTIDNIIEKMQSADTIEVIANYLLQVQENRIKQNSVLTSLVKEKRQTENSINNIMEAIEQGGQSATVMKRMRELETKLTDIEKRLTIEKSQTAFRLTKDQIKEFYKAGLEKEPLKLINYFVKEIRLYDDKMIIEYNTPKTINLDESQGFSFYEKNVKMPYVIQNKKYYELKDFRLIMRI